MDRSDDPPASSAHGIRELTSLDLTRGYLRRIADLNPQLRAIIETNPNAETIAAHLDSEHRKGGLRGSLHGIPILVKDNIATDDAHGDHKWVTGTCQQQGALGRAPVVARLRTAGAVILGKANLGEWANFRGFNPLGFYGWTARGGPTHNPHLLPR